MLALLCRASGRRFAGAGTRVGAGALLGYAVLFSAAYLRIDAGVGALILFGAVQVTMLGAGLRGAGRPRPGEWAGLILALAGLAGLTLPGKAAPDLVGAALMAGAGACWGVYSLRGRGGGPPLESTAGNFLLAAPLALLLALLYREPPPSREGALLAVISGGITSGIGYSLWYAALPALGVVQGAIVQLAVPVLALAAAIALLGEQASARTLAAAALELGGVLLAVLSRSRGR